MTDSLATLLPRRHRNVRTVVALLVGIALLFVVPHVISTFHTFVATRVLILAIFAMALNVVFGQGGLPSLGHAAFFGIGGYVVALGLVKWGWSFSTIVVVTVISGLVFGALVGLLTVRTEGIYLLLLTLAVGQSLWALAFELRITQGDNGIAGIDRATIPVDVVSPAAFYNFVLVIALILVAVMWIWVRSPVGRALVGARESKSRAEAFGYRIWAFRIGAFALSGTISAIAGMLLVYLQGIASPELLNWTLSAEILVMAILGGASSFFGPAIGAGVVIVLEQVVSSYTERWTMVLGAVFIAAMLFLPNGLTGLWARFDRSAPQE
ncbi:MAG: branched-chain amino acid ABC transporter permease [Acidimicrobiia bacterium]